ncbi:hypothetical protein BN940_13551 [Castellaniella defragrans 65Phen]|uniref:Uncharacterized protein n=1 Tax=Castellaniella defragrans (strain DSM 12143 / CCUG 39792 / 65Phen) TaxID=1437824 RepID=W8WZZ4_CASD6|nr:hypothetical protein BN940_13551 [Castellaniella defragrans 65Phen]
MTGIPRRPPARGRAAREKTPRIRTQSFSRLRANANKRKCSRGIADSPGRMRHSRCPPRSLCLAPGPIDNETGSNGHSGVQSLLDQDMPCHICSFSMTMIWCARCLSSWAASAATPSLRQRA